MAPSKEEKERFFEALYQLDDFISEDDEPLSAPAQTLPHPFSLARSYTTAQPDQPEPSNTYSQATSLHMMSLPQPLVPNLSSAKTGETDPRKPPSPLVSRKLSNKKSTHSLPVANQIFSGFTFYFVPNNDVAAPRRKRIEKAIQYGAVWEKVWPGGVTHVVVDSNVIVQDVLRIMRLDKLPVSHEARGPYKY